MKFGLNIGYGDLERVFEWAKLADDAGFKLLTVPDHLFHPMDNRFFARPAWNADAILGALAVSTRSISLGPAVTDTVRRHPATTAHFIATLDRISGGRAYLGIGAGEKFNFEPLDDIVWDKPLARLREAVTVIRMLWKSTREEPANFNGEFFGLHNAWLGYKAVQQPHPPIYIGGYGPKMRALVAELGDGWLPWMEVPETYRQSSDEITEMAVRLGRKPQEIDRAVIVYTSVSGSEEAHAEVIRRAAASLAMRQRLLKQLGQEELANESTDLLRATFAGVQADKMYSVANRVPRDLAERLILSGKPDQVIERIAQYEKAGVRTIVLQPLNDVIGQTVNTYRDRILPYFAARDRQ